jgi:hypothetical protein
MDWLTKTDEEIMAIATPIMDNLMQASTDIDHARHVRDFSDNMKAIVTRDNLTRQCKQYQAELGSFTKRELVGIFRKKTDVRIFWRQWYSKSDDEFVAFMHLMFRDGKFEVVNVGVS